VTPEASYERISSKAYGVAKRNVGPEKLGCAEKLSPKRRKRYSAGRTVF